VVLLPAVVPLAGGALKVERCRPHLLVLGRAVRTEKLLALVDPGDGILVAVVLRETELVAGALSPPEYEPESKRPCFSRSCVCTFLMEVDRRA